MDELGFVKAYRRLKETFQSPSQFRNIDYRLSMNPPKQAFSYASSFSNECIVRSTNVMYAQTENGLLTKVITIDDATRKKDERIVYVDNSGKIICKDNIGLTRLRCGMMATLAVDLNHFGGSDKKVGFIGNGAINQATAELLNAYFGITDFVIRGSENRRDKNYDKFRTFGTVKADNTESLEILNECDIVISCTNACGSKHLISNKQLSNPKLIIAQDSGYILDESFRTEEGMFMYTDHPEQLSMHYKDEFPFDSNEHYIPLMEDSYFGSRKTVYLYGIAMADAIVFEEMFLS